jgi:hypothetical protein
MREKREEGSRDRARRAMGRKAGAEVGTPKNSLRKTRKGKRAGPRVVPIAGRRSTRPSKGARYRDLDAAPSRKTPIG